MPARTAKSSPTCSTRRWRPDRDTRNRDLRRQLVVQALTDLVAPFAVYYLLRGAGVPVLWSALLGGAVPAVRTVAVALRQCRVEVAGLVIVTLFVVGGLVSIVTGDVRLLFADLKA